MLRYTYQPYKSQLPVTAEVSNLNAKLSNIVQCFMYSSNTKYCICKTFTELTEYTALEI